MHLYMTYMLFIFSYNFFFSGYEGIYTFIDLQWSGKQLCALTLVSEVFHGIFEKSSMGEFGSLFCK